MGGYPISNGNMALSQRRSGRARGPWSNRAAGDAPGSYRSARHSDRVYRTGEAAGHRGHQCNGGRQ